MIHFDSSSWCNTLLRWDGTSIQATCYQTLIFFVYVSMAYLVDRYMELNLGSAYDHSALLGHALSFLLVFRANSSYQRYAQGQLSCIQFFANLRDFNVLAGTTIRGGRGQFEWNRRCGEDGFSLERRKCLDDDYDNAASEIRFQLARWSLCLAIAFRIHMRIAGDGFLWGSLDEDTKLRLNWERMRLRTLMSREEFQVVDQQLRVEDLDEENALLWASGLGKPQVFHPGFNTYASHKHRKDRLAGPGKHNPDQPQEFAVSTEPGSGQMLVIFYRLMQIIRGYMHEPFSYKERFSSKFINLGTELIEVKDQVHQVMTTPLPLPFVNLVRTLLFLYLLCMPFFADYTDGLWANVIMPTLMAMALLGIEQIGTELENPFGNDANDIDVQEMISTLEMQLMRMMEMVGDATARQRFTWLPVPQFMQEETSSPFRRYLAVRTEVAHIHVPLCATSDMAGHQSGNPDLPSACTSRRGAFDGGLSIRRVQLGGTTNTLAVAA